MYTPNCTTTQKRTYTTAFETDSEKNETQNENKKPATANAICETNPSNITADSTTSKNPVSNEPNIPNVREIINDITHLILTTTSTREIYDKINSIPQTDDKNKIQTYLWIIAFRKYKEKLLPDDYSQFTQFVGTFILGANIELSKEAFDEVKLLTFDTIMDSALKSDDILERFEALDQRNECTSAILAQERIFFAICSFLHTNKEKNFENFKISRSRIKVLDYTDKLTKVVAETDIEDDHTILFCQSSNTLYFETYGYVRKKTFTDLGYDGKKDSQSIEQYINREMLDIHTFTLYRNTLCSTLLNEYSALMNYTYEVKAYKDKPERKISISNIHHAQPISSNQDNSVIRGSSNLLHIIKTVFNNTASPEIHPILIYTILQKIKYGYVLTDSDTMELFKFAFQKSKKEKKENTHHREELQAAVIYGLKFARIESTEVRMLCYATCLKLEKIKTINSKLSIFKNANINSITHYQSILKNHSNNQVMIDVVQNILDKSNNVFINSDSLKEFFNIFSYMEDSDYMQNALTIKQSCLNICIKHIKRLDSVTKKEDRDKLIVNMFGQSLNIPENNFIAFGETVVKTILVNQELSFDTTDKLIKYFLDYRKHYSLKRLKQSKHLKEYFINQFSCANKNYTVGSEPERDKILYDLLNDEIITISEIGFTPDMLVTLCQTVNNSGLALLAQKETIEYFATNHVESLTNIFTNHMHTLISFTPNELLKQRINLFLVENLKLPRELIPQLWAHLIPDSGFIQYNHILKRTNDTSFETINSVLYNFIDNQLEKSNSKLAGLAKIIPDFKTKLLRVIGIFLNGAFYPTQDLLNHIVAIAFQNAPLNIKDIVTPIKEILEPFWNNILCKQVFPSRFYQLVETKRQQINTANIEPYQQVKDKYIEFITTYFQSPDAISTIHDEQVKQVSNQIKSLDDHLKDTNSDLFAQYVLVTSHFRSVEELYNISIKLTPESVYYTALRDLVFYLQDILCLESNDICPIVVIPNPATTHYIEYPEERRLIRLTCSINGQPTSYLSYNYLGRNPSTTIFSRSSNPETTPQETYPKTFFKVTKDRTGRVQYPGTPITPEALKKINAPIHLINYYTVRLGKYNREFIAQIIKDNFEQIVKCYPQQINLNDTNLNIVKSQIYFIATNLGRVMFTDENTKQQIFEQTSDEWFAHEYSSLVVEYLHEITNKDNVNINAIKNLVNMIKLSIIKDSVKLLLDKIAKKFSHFNMVADPIKQIRDACDLHDTNKYKDYHIDFFIGLVYLYLSSKHSLAIVNNTQNSALSFFRLNGLYHIAKCLDGIIQSDNLLQPNQQQNDKLIRNLMLEIFNILDIECSSLIASRLSTPTSTPILKDMITTINMMLSQQKINTQAITQQATTTTTTTSKTSA